MDRPGVDIRPLRQITGSSHFNEVFFDEVSLTDEQRLGPLNGGWVVASTGLGGERSVMSDEDDGILRSPVRKLFALARHLGVTPRHLARLFHADVGITPGEFVERMRVEHARRLLERTDLTTDRVAAESGLGSVETLHRVFRTRLGSTPREYRQRFAAFQR